MARNKNLMLLYLALFMTLVISISIYIYANKTDANQQSEDDIKQLLIDTSEKLHKGLQKTDTLSLQ